MIIGWSDVNLPVMQEEKRIVGCGKLYEIAPNTSRDGVVRFMLKCKVECLVIALTENLFDGAWPNIVSGYTSHGAVLVLEAARETVLVVVTIEEGKFEICKRPRCHTVSAPYTVRTV